MRTKIGWFVGWLSVIWLTAACAPTISQSAPMVVTRPFQPQWPDELMWVRPEGAEGELVVYNMGDGRPAFTLLPGRLTADQRHYFAPTMQADTTEVSQFDPNNGQMVGSFALDGRWQLQGVSPNGRNKAPTLEKTNSVF